MKSKLVPLISAILLAFVIVQPALAHGDEPRLEISPEKLSPGAVLDIRGVDFEFEEQVTLTLYNDQTEAPFGTVLADVEGVFLLSITLPFDLHEGTYVIRAMTDDHTVESPPITVAGTAVDEGGGQGERDEDDALLAPMPTYAPGVSSTPIPQVEPGANTAPETSSPYLLWVIASLGVILVIAYIRMTRR